jgi:3-hydroxyisobutyrate dehydrogenase-like beta-hydroxyacid dehydrogenase
MKVGFIGLGNMGAGMAANLIKAGDELSVYNRPPEKARPLVEQGARLARDVGDACRSEVVVTTLTGDHALGSVVFGEDAILASLPRGAVHIPCSTISLQLAEKLSAAHANKGQHFVSAPVFGRPEAAAAAKLFVVVAGLSAAVERGMPLFDAMGQRTFRFGEKPSLANLVKLSGNFLIAAVIQSLGEAMALAGKGGLDQHQFLDFLT